MNSIIDVLKDNLNRKYNGHTTEEVLRNFRAYLDDMQESITDSIKDNQSIPSVQAYYQLQNIKQFLEDIESANIIHTVEAMNE